MVELLQLLGRLAWGVYKGGSLCFDNALHNQQWLSRLLKLSCHLAGESRRFDWLSSARLSESKPTAWLSLKKNWAGLGWLGSGSARLHQLPQHYGDLTMTHTAPLSAKENHFATPLGLHAK